MGGKEGEGEEERKGGRKGKREMKLNPACSVKFFRSLFLNVFIKYTTLPQGQMSKDPEKIF